MREDNIIIGFETFRSYFHYLSGFIFLTITTICNNRKLIFDKISSIEIKIYLLIEKKNISLTLLVYFYLFDQMMNVRAILDQYSAYLNVVVRYKHELFEHDLIIEYVLHPDYHHRDFLKTRRKKMNKIKLE